MTIYPKCTSCPGALGGDVTGKGVGRVTKSNNIVDTIERFLEVGMAEKSEVPLPIRLAAVGIKVTGGKAGKDGVIHQIEISQDRLIRLLEAEEERQLKLLREQVGKIVEKFS